MNVGETLEIALKSRVYYSRMFRARLLELCEPAVLIRV